MEQGNISEGIAQEPIRVDMDEWTVVKTPSTVETTGLGPCVGVMMYDPISKEAVVGHFPDPSDFDDPTEREKEYSFTGMLRTSKDIFKDPSVLKVWLGGKAPFDPKLGDEEVLAYETQRNADIEVFLTHAFEQYPIKREQIVVRWNKDPRESTIMKLDTSMGTMTYDIEDKNGKNHLEQG